MIFYSDTRLQMQPCLPLKGSTVTPSSHPKVFTNNSVEIRAGLCTQNLDMHDHISQSNLKYLSAKLYAQLNTVHHTNLKQYTIYKYFMV